MKIIDIIDTSKYKIHLFNENKIVFFENDPCNYLGIVIEGTIKISSFLNDGKEIIYNIVESNMMFGNNLIFSSSATYKGNVISLTKSKVILLNKSQLLDLIKTNSNFLDYFINFQAESALILHQKVKLLTLTSTKDKLLFLLKENNNKLVIKSISELATRLYLTRESTSRIVNKLIKESIIEYKKGIITLK